MKLILFEHSGTRPMYGLIRGDTAVPLDQQDLQAVIEARNDLRPVESGAVPLAQVRLLPPVPHPGKIVVTTATYGSAEPAQQLLATLKSAESVIGPGDTVRLPQVEGNWQFVPQAMLGLVIRGPAKNVSAADWQKAVFGYTCVIDVMARGDQQFGRDFWLAKADTLGPLGPCIVTLDEIVDPASLRVRSWQNGSAAQDFPVSGASHSIGEQVEFVTTVMTLHSGDVLACGTSQNGQRPLADGDRVEVEIDGIGRLEVGVAQQVEVLA